MRLSTKATYGMRAICDLALHYKDGSLSVREISKRENISIRYLEQLLNKLKKFGFVKSIRGPKGGYILAKNPKEIRLSDLLLTLEGQITPVKCTINYKDTKLCHRIDNCVSKILWDKLGRAITDVLDKTTLKNLCDEAKRLKG